MRASTSQIGPHSLFLHSLFIPSSSTILHFSLPSTTFSLLAAMSDADDHWVHVALSDDSLVVELLLCLNRPPPLNPLSPSLPLHWSVRQPRSRPILPRHNSDSALKDSDAAARASPTTPLTWSSGGGGGATSVSGGFAHAARSKNAGKSEVVATMKRPRKKKTLGELKEEEILLMKERRSLKDALATLQLNVEKQRSINGSLKKMKLDFQSHQATEMAVASADPKEASSDQPQPQALLTSICNTAPVGVDASYQLPLPNVSCKLQEVGTIGRDLLPDLNLPFQEDSGAEVPYRMS